METLAQAVNQDADNGFLEGLFYEDMLPLEWRRQNTAPEESYIAHINEADDETFRMLSIMEERVVEKSEDGTTLAAEVARLEIKVNLLLDMVGQILANHLLLPAQTPVRLGARGIEFAHTHPPAVNDHIVMSLYLHTRYPRPLEVLGKVHSVDDTGSGAYWVRVRFEHVSAAVEDGLEKFVFRRHRRLVAHSRTLHHPGTDFHDA